METLKLFRCSCYGEALGIELDDDDTAPTIDMAIWYYGQGNILSWKDRIRWCCKILTTGKPWSDNIVFRPDQANKIGHYLVNLTEGKSTKTKLRGV